MFSCRDCFSSGQVAAESLGPQGVASVSPADHRIRQAERLRPGEQRGQVAGVHFEKTWLCTAGKYGDGG